MFTMETSAIAQIAGVGDCKTLTEWRDALPALKAVTYEQLAEAMPDAPEDYLRTMFDFHAQVFRDMQALCDLVGDAYIQFDTMEQSPQAVRDFVRKLSVKNLPKSLLETPQETPEQKRERNRQGLPPAEAPVKRLADAISAGNIDIVIEEFKTLEYYDRLLIFRAYYSHLSSDLVPVSNPIQNITVPLTSVVGSMYRNKPIELDTEIVPRKSEPVYQISTDYEAITDAIQSKVTGATVTFSEYERQIMDKLCTLYEHPSGYINDYPCCTFQDVYRLLVGDLNAKIPAGKADEIARIIDKHARHRVTVDFTKVPNYTGNVQSVDAQLLSVNVATVKNPKSKRHPKVKVIYFLQEPVTLTIARSMGMAQGKRPYIQHIPLKAYKLPDRISATERSNSTVGYLVRAITQMVYATKNPNMKPADIIAIDPLFSAVGETLPSKKTKVLELAEEYLNKITQEDPKPFPELKAWAWVDDQGKHFTTRARNRHVHGIWLDIQKQNK